MMKGCIGCGQVVSGWGEGGEGQGARIRERHAGRVSVVYSGAIARRLSLSSCVVNIKLNRKIGENCMGKKVLRAAAQHATRT